ncbi:helix-turn-helix domain-containing protein [Gaoshiqia sediminis]|uniref:Helix-turn-helix domain-containing protein n=1 Tax=Gaoshiqia sediminis TaxID=2986998 RepID=A0AA41YBZ7_9BACT|nr:helix-turn-helix domain-containing protein [Gaoshiqia sediminis]MCW0483503.1 helix-turn-helix domain-containing protein [Gaoshiqia sediminis]
MEKVMILSTAEEIAKGLKMILDEHSSNKKKPTDFETEKMTVGDGARYIDVSYQTLCKWINAGKVPVHGKGRTRFLLRSELIEAYKKIE